jgi:predicted nucleic acid-binding protein
MRSFVIDASVAVKWYIPEVLSHEAALLLGQTREGEVTLLVPDLFFAEFGNVLWKKLGRNELDAEITREILRSMAMSCPVKTVSCSLLAPAAFEIALAFNRTVYDSLYVALAQSRQVPFITADERLVNALRQTPLGHVLRFLGDENQWMIR